MDKVYKNTNYLNSMGIDLKNLSSASLDELEELREAIDDRIHIIKGRESLKTEKTYSEKEAEEFMKKCLEK